MPCDTKTSEIDVDWSGSGHHYSNVRFGSGSSQASQSSGDICRICHCESDNLNPLLTPCHCAGSLKYVHQACLQQWLTASETNSCELCKFEFIMHTKIKPFNEWRSLDISGIERRRLCCSVLFHIAAALCVIWSLCVLIERAADDVKKGLIDWPFWTKLAVVTVGLTGGVVFMYIQCKAYLHLCHRWKARNRILLIQNAPEKVHPLSAQTPPSHHRNSSSQQIGPGRSSESRSMAASSNARGMCHVATASNAYNYASSASGMNSGSLELDGTVALHHHHHHHNQQQPHHNHHSHRLPASPNHMLQQADLNMDPLGQRIMQQLPHHQMPSQSHLGQVAVSANIECSQSQHNYERDWALDDVVSQISSFHPCPQGSGSMTPFLDSIHNVLEHSGGGSSRGSVNDVCSGSRQDDLSTGGISSDTREHVLQLSSFSGSEHKAPSISSGVSSAVANGLGGFVYKPHSKRYSNSSIFLENRDILNDSDNLGLELEGSCGSGVEAEYSKMLDYRHSSILTPPADDDLETDQMAKYLGKDLRRYSDTKLLAGGDAEALDAMFDGEQQSRRNERHITKQHSEADVIDAIIDIEGLQRRSLNAATTTVGTTAAAATDCNMTSAQQIDKARLFFKSLPNLSSSCESLIKK